MTSKSLSLHHLFRPARGNYSKGVLFLLHGYGSNEEDLYSFAEELPRELDIISVRAPYALHPSAYAWYAIGFDEAGEKWSDYKEAIASRDKIVEFIKEAIQAYALHTGKVTLLGFSQGAALSYAVALSYPKLVDNVIALSGYIDPRLIDVKTDSYTGLHIYASHGTEDQIVPVKWARKISPFLKESNVEHIYEEYRTGHNIIPQNFFSFKNWLIKHL